MQTSTQAVRARTDEPFLERFIEAHEAFVLRCASRYAGFAVTRSDDEYSVALLAFYEAIKGYDPASGPFGAYASLVIGRRLADHYRSQHRFDAETPLAPQTFDGTVDRESADAAMQQAVAEQMSEAKPVSAQDEIEAANTVFEKYGFAFYDLAASSPKSDKTRRSCAAAVGTLLHLPVLFASMQSAHSLPIKALAQQCPVILLDEPTAFLDIISRIEVMNLLHRLAREEHKAVLLSTHDVDQALLLADSLWLMSQQNGLLCGTTEDLVLNGSLNRFFSRGDVEFDPDNGRFRHCGGVGRTVSVEAADDRLLLWARNALMRNGYAAQSGADGNDGMRLRVHAADNIEFFRPDGVAVRCASFAEWIELLNETDCG